MQKLPALFIWYICHNEYAITVECAKRWEERELIASFSAAHRDQQSLNLTAVLFWLLNTIFFYVIKKLYVCASICIINTLSISFLRCIVGHHRRRLQLQTPSYLLLFMSFPLRYFFLYSVIRPVRLICLLLHCIDFHFERVMPSHVREKKAAIYAKASVLHISSRCLPVTRNTQPSGAPLFWILTLRLSGPATLCLDINIYWQRTIPHRHVVRPGGGGSDRRPRTRGQEFCL